MSGRSVCLMRTSIPGPDGLVILMLSFNIISYHITSYHSILYLILSLLCPACLFRFIEHCRSSRRPACSCARLAEEHDASTQMETPAAGTFRREY